MTVCLEISKYLLVNGTLIHTNDWLSPAGISRSLRTCFQSYFETELTEVVLLSHDISLLRKTIETDVVVSTRGQPYWLLFCDQISLSQTPNLLWQCQPPRYSQLSSFTTPAIYIQTISNKVQTMGFSSALAKASGFVSPSPQRSTAYTSHTHNSRADTVLEARSESGSMSPTKRRTEKWLQGHSPTKKNSDLGLRRVKDGRVVKKNSRDQRKKRASFWNVALWFSGSGTKGNDECEEDELEGDTMVDEEGSVDTTGYDNDDTLVTDEQDERVKGDRTAHSLRDHNRDPRVQQDWTDEERWLFTKLNNRGFEPLVHNTWVLDYPQFPYQLFTNDESQVYINNTHGSTGRGTQHQSAVLHMFCN